MFKHCQKASVFNEKHIEVALARVTDQEEDAVVLIFDDDVLEQLDSEMDVMFYDGDMGLVTCRCGFSGYRDRKVVEPDGKAVMKYATYCQIGEVIGIEQRRRDIKVRVGFPLVMETRNEEGKLLKVPVKTKNISAGGIAFETTYALKKGERMSFPFDQGDKMVDLQAEILWVKETEEEGKPFLYGCRFVDMNLTKEGVVRRYVYQEQMKDRRIED